MSEIILKAISDLQQGKMIVIVDDVTRENEGDIVVAAEKITEELMTFMIKKASGLICLSIVSELANRLKISAMVKNNQESMRTAFTVSIDAKHGITTGISAIDRTHTILTAINHNSSANDIVTPGHMFPLIAKEGGVLERRGHTEASIDLVKMAGLTPAAVICEILGDDGKMLRGKDLENFAKNNQLELIHIDEIVNYLKEKR